MGIKRLFKKRHLELHWGLFRFLVMYNRLQQEAHSLWKQLMRHIQLFLCVYVWKLHSQWGSLCSFLLTTQFCSSLDCLQLHHTDVSLESFSLYMTSQTWVDLQRNLRLNFKTLFLSIDGLSPTSLLLFSALEALSSGT